MQKKAFSLLEIIFVILIIAVVITAAVSKFGTAFDTTNIAKIKADILEIRAGINLYSNKMILKNQNDSLNFLDNNDKKLFNIILAKPIRSSNEKKTANWSKVSSNIYKVYLNSTNSLTFQYNPTNKTFDCDISNILCKELDI